VHDPPGVARSGARDVSEEEEKPRRRRRRKRRSRPSDPSQPGAPRRSRLTRGAAWTLAVLGLVVLVGAVLLMIVYPAPHGPGGGGRGDVELTVVGDEPPNALAARLGAAGLIADPRFFSAYARLSGAEGRLAKGAPLLTDDLSPREVLARLERRGAAAHVRVT